jgi:DNA-binding NarL/FixJ family response regulator
MSTTVLLVDDHDLIRQGLSRAFERQEEFTVVAQAASVADAEQKAHALQPDIVVTDVRLPDGSGLDLVRHLRAKRPEVGIVVLTMFADDGALFAALDAGASAFVRKDALSDEVVAAARHAAVSPNTFTAPDLATALRRRMAPSGPQLSRREREVLQLLGEGLGVAEVGQRLFISLSTAKTHVANIYDKLGATNRAQAIMFGISAGLMQGMQTTEGDATSYVRPI